LGTSFGPSVTTQFKAGGFTMTDSFFLDSVTIAVEAPSPGANANVQIWTGDTAPDTFMAQLSGPSFDSDGDFTFTPGGQVELTAGETYWVYLDNTDPDGSFVWSGSNEIPSGSGASFVGYNFNGNPSSFENRFQVEGTLVPAPGTGLAIGLGLLGVARRRR